MRHLHKLPVVLFFLLSLTAGQPALAQETDSAENPDPATEDVQATDAQPQDTQGEASEPGQTLGLKDGKALAQYLQALLDEYITAVEAQAADSQLHQIIERNDAQALEAKAAEIQQQLGGSLKVRLVPAGNRPLDFENSPACGFTCVQMVELSKDQPQPAEALLYKTPEANITLVRKITGKNNKHLGAIVVHYPYTLITDAFKRLPDIGLYNELRQYSGGKPNTLFTHGDRSVREGPAQKQIRIKNTHWRLSIWTPGGVAVEKYEPPALPWLQIILGVFILVGGVIFLIVYHKKQPKKPAAREIPKTDAEDFNLFHGESIASYHDDTLDDEASGGSERTLVFGGGAAEVDISAYLKKEDITNLKKKMEDSR